MMEMDIVAVVFVERKTTFRSWHSKKKKSVTPLVVVALSLLSNPSVSLPLSILSFFTSRRRLFDRDGSSRPQPFS